MLNPLIRSGPTWLFHAQIWFKSWTCGISQCRYRWIQKVILLNVWHWSVFELMAQKCATRNLMLHHEFNFRKNGKCADTVYVTFQYDTVILDRLHLEACSRDAVRGDFACTSTTFKCRKYARSRCEGNIEVRRQVSDIKQVTISKLVRTVIIN